MASNQWDLRLDIASLGQYLRADPELQAGIRDATEQIAAAAGITDVEIKTDVTDRFRAVLIAKHGRRSSDELGGRLIAGATSLGLDTKRK